MLTSSKHLDRIVPKIRVHSLIKKNFHGKMLKLLIATYSNLCSSVKIDTQKCTSLFKCNIGTMQGSKLSTILFTLFISDLKGKLNNSGIIQIDPDVLTTVYADDMANVGDTVRASQAQIDIIARFCARTKYENKLAKNESYGVPKMVGLLVIIRNGIFMGML